MGFSIVTHWTGEYTHCTCSSAARCWAHLSVYWAGRWELGPRGATAHSCSSALITRKRKARMIIMRITKLLWSERTSAAPADCYSLHHQHKQSGTGESQVSHRWVTALLCFHRKINFFWSLLSHSVTSVQIFHTFLTKPWGALTSTIKRRVSEWRGLSRQPVVDDDDDEPALHPADLFVLHLYLQAVVEAVDLQLSEDVAS